MSRHRGTPAIRSVAVAALVTGLGLFATRPVAAQDAEPPAPPAEKPASQADPNLPDGRDIVDQAIAAEGGRDAFKKIESISMVGSGVVPSIGATFGIEFHSGTDGKFAIKQTMPTGQEITIGCDGDVAWGVDPMTMGYQLIEGEAREQSLRQANIQMIVLRVRDHFDTFETVERVAVDDVDTYKVRLTVGDEEQFMFFNVDDHLPCQSVVPSAAGSVTLKFGDFADFGDVKLFKKLTVDQGGMAAEMTFDQIAINQTADDVFTQPAEVRKLVEENKALDKPDSGAAKSDTKPKSGGGH